MTRHRWSEKAVITPNKSERECLNGCGLVMVHRHEYPDGNPFGVHWEEFWRGLDQLEVRGPCTGRAGGSVAYDARNYPL